MKILFAMAAMTFVFCTSGFAADATQKKVEQPTEKNATCTPGYIASGCDSKNCKDSACTAKNCEDKKCDTQKCQKKK